MAAGDLDQAMSIYWDIGGGIEASNVSQGDPFQSTRPTIVDATTDIIELPSSLPSDVGSTSMSIGIQGKRFLRPYILNCYRSLTTDSS